MKKVILCLFTVLLVFTQGCCRIFSSGRHNISDDSLSQGANDNQTGLHDVINPDKASIARSKIYAIPAFYKSKTKTKTLHKSIKEIYRINILFWPRLFIDLVTEQVYENEPKECECNFNQ